MIEVSGAPLAAEETDAIVRPTRADWTATTPEVRRLDVEAGEGWLERCAAQGELLPGGAAITQAGALPAEFVIHLALSSREEPVSARTVSAALRNGLRRAAEWGVKRLAMPLLGTGPGELSLEMSCRLLAPLLEAFVAEAEGRAVRIAAEDAAEREAALATWDVSRRGR